MDITTSFEGFLDNLSSSPLREHEDIKKLAERLSNALKVKDERDGNGKLTQAAKDARQTIANPRLQTTHRNTKRRAVATAYDNQSHVYREALSTAIFEGMKAEQIKLELDRYEPTDDDTDGTGRTREDHGQAYPTRFLKPLMRALHNNEVAHSAFQRVPAYTHDLVARIYQAGHDDPHLEDEKGLLAAIARSGVFELFRGSMDETEAAALDTLLARPKNPDIVELQRAFHERFPDSPPISSDFLLGCIRMGEQTDQLSPGAFEASRQSADIICQNDAKVVATILGWDDNRMVGAQMISRFIRQRAHADDNGTDRASFYLFQIQLMLERLQPEAGSSDEWFPRFQAWITAFAEQLGPVIRSEVIFFAILYAAFDNSFAKVSLEELTRSKEFSRQLAELEKSRRDALASGKNFKLAHDGMAITEDEEEYHFIQSLPINSETAMFGKLLPLGDESPKLENGEPARFVTSSFELEEPEVVPDADQRDTLDEGEHADGSSVVRVTPNEESQSSDPAEEALDRSMNSAEPEIYTEESEPGDGATAVPEIEPKPSVRPLPMINDDEDDWDD